MTSFVRDAIRTAFYSYSGDLHLYLKANIKENNYKEKILNCGLNSF